jgi:hypothetical protein
MTPAAARVCAADAVITRFRGPRIWQHGPPRPDLGSLALAGGKAVFPTVADQTGPFEQARLLYEQAVSTAMTVRCPLRT